MSYNKETSMYEGYIYKIVNDVNNKVYIGQTIRTISERWSQHKSAARTHVDTLALHMAMNKYKIESFHIKKMEKLFAKTLEDLYIQLNDKEIFYINKYNSQVPNGYNISSGGAGASGTGCREIISYDPYTKEIVYYKSIDEASLHNNVPTSNIITCCQGTNSSVNGKIYKYKEDGISKKDIEEYFDSHPLISQYDLLGNKLNIFMSSIEAAEFLKENDKLEDLTVSTILKNIGGCCRGDRQTAYGYVWRRMNDSFDKYPLNLNRPRHKEKFVDKPIDVYTIYGTFVGSFVNIKDAFNVLKLEGKQQNQAILCCRGESTNAFGYVWRFKDESFDKYSCATINGKLRINKYTLDGIFVDTYNNYTDAAYSVETTNRKAISDSCKHENHMYRNFLWFYINDPNQPDKTKIIA